MPVHLIESTLQEELAEHLVQRMHPVAGVDDSLRVQTVVVQNTGLGRWLRLWHARRCGISAAVKMPFAQSFIARELEQEDRYERWHEWTPNQLRWQIFDYFQRAGFDSWEDAGPLAEYLDPALAQVERRRWSLSGHLANLYDRYAVHRPQWIFEWLRQARHDAPLPHLPWQARLLHEVVRGMGLSVEELERRWIGLALHRANREPGTANGAASAVHVFGITSFPTAYLQFFQRMGAAREVFLYHLIPSEAYLGDLPKNYRSHLLEALDQGPLSITGAADLQNPLLVANGQTAARFQSLLLALDFPVGEMPDMTPGEDTTDLQQLQHAVRLNEPYCGFLADGTVSVHRCHSRIREVQVLQQQLLALIAAAPTIRPEEIMVLVPEIGDYTDAIQSVFGTGTRHGPDADSVSLPYCIADQPDSESEICWQFFQALLRLLKGRQLFSEVRALLDFEPVCHRLGLDRDELKELLALLHASGIRWGINGSHRREKSLVDYEAYSWEYGLQLLYHRFIFGEAAVGASSATPLSAQMQQAIGSLVQVLSPVFALARRSRERQSFQAWSEALLSVLHPMLGDHYAGGEWMRVIALAVGELQNTATDAAIGFETFCTILKDGNAEAKGPSGLLRRGITFCRMQPARHIPTRVLCLLGLNEGSYPRRPMALEFDLIELQRRNASRLKGSLYQYRELDYLSDVPVRDEDRQLFLDLLSNARDHLYLSYIGQSALSNETLPPSILVSELLQFLGRVDPASHEDPKLRQAELERINLRHPLQDWSPTNFIEPQPNKGEPPVPIHFNLRYAQMEPPTGHGGRSFIERDAIHTVADNHPSQLSVTAEQLLRFLKDPAKDYLKQQLHLNLDMLDWSEIDADDEVFELNSLGGWGLRQQVLHAWLVAKQTGNVSDAFAPQLKQAWQENMTLPPGHAGNEIWSEHALPILTQLQQHLTDRTIRKGALTHTLEGVRFEHEYWEVDDGKRLIFLNGDLKKGKYLLEACIQHIGALRGSWVVNLAERTQVEWSPYDARETEGQFGFEWLRALLSLWRQNTHAPIPFSLEIAYHFVQEVRQGKPEHESLQKAYDQHWSNYNGIGEDGSASQCLCFEGDSPAGQHAPTELREAFMENATLVFGPALDWLDQAETIQGGVS